MAFNVIKYKKVMVKKEIVGAKNKGS